MLLAHRYKMIRKCGGGSFGSIFILENVSTSQLCAAKIQHSSSGQLAHQAHVYSSLQGAFGFPQLHYAGEEEQGFILILDLLGPSMQKLNMLCGGSLSMRSVGMIAHQVLTRLQTIHRKGWVHQDIKPENMLLKDNDSHIIYLIDFGLARQYLDEDRRWLPQEKNRLFAGTYRFASWNSMAGFSQTPKDDLESLLYSIAYLLFGKLPWDSIEIKTPESVNTVIKEKQYFLECMDDSCRALKRLTKYVRQIRYGERIEYEKLRRICKEDLCETDQLTYDYDWKHLQCQKHGVKLVLV